jgi:hypothetical protein
MTKSDESDSSNFLKRKIILLLSDKQSFAATFVVKNLILQKIIFDVNRLYEIAMINERF